MALVLDRFEIQELKSNARNIDGNIEALSYISFFNVLREFPKFDGKGIKRALEGSSTLSRFSDSKSYLYHKLLDAIQNANSNRSSDISDIYAQITILVNKGLHNQVPTLYAKALEFAKDCEDFEEVLKLLRLRKSIILHTMRAKELSSEIELVSQQEKETQLILENLQEWELLISEIYIAKGKSGSARTEVIESIQGDDLMHPDAPKLSQKAQIASFTLNEKLLGIDDLSSVKRIPFLRNIINVVLSNRNLLDDALICERLFYALLNVGLLSIIYHDSENFSFAKEQLESLSNERHEFEVLVFERKSKLNLKSCLYRSMYAEGLLLENEVLRGLEKFGSRMSKVHLIDISLDMALLYFHSQQWSRMSQILFKLLNEEQSSNIENRTISVWLLYLIAQFQLGNYDVVRSYSKYGLKFIRNIDAQLELPRFVFEFLPKIASKNSIGSRKNSLATFRKELSYLLDQSEHSYFKITVPFLKWIDDEIEL